MAPKVKRKSSSASLGQTLNTKKPRVSDGADCPPHVLKVLEWLTLLRIDAQTICKTVNLCALSSD